MATVQASQHDPVRSTSIALAVKQAEFGGTTAVQMAALAVWEWKTFPVHVLGDRSHSSILSTSLLSEKQVRKEISY
jgi:hypothetical protein